ncbi:MAG: hypothetical protein JWQ49_6693 [Edaphobacter sp.]|nr:hypothetical protein [Edaphobacter sp.]
MSVARFLLTAGILTASCVKALTGAAAIPPPHIDLSCREEVTPGYKSADEELESSRAYVDWKSTGATALWRLDDMSPQPLNGTARTFGLILVAVGPGGIVQAVGGCRITSKPFTGRNGLMISSKEVFSLDPDVIRRQSVKQDLLDSAISPEEFDRRLSAVLEGWGYTVGSGPSDLNSSIRYTPQYNDRPGLCDAACRALDIHKEVAFILTFSVVNKGKGKWDYKITVMPQVMMRYEREGGLFKPDKDGVQVAIPICRELIELVLKK